MKFRVGDIVEMKHGGPYKYRIVGVFPMVPDRVDVVDANEPNDSLGVGIPISWIEGEEDKPNVEE